jgi:CheY-like chemotaxis protein
MDAGTSSEEAGRADGDTALSPGWRILVVDDDEDTVTSTAVLLQLWGHEVVTARDGATALETAASWRPNVVMLDVVLPLASGYEVARRLRRLPDLDGLRLIAVTGAGRESDIRLAREAGFDHHLLKPVDCKILMKLAAPPPGFGRDP